MKKIAEFVFLVMVMSGCLSMVTTVIAQTDSTAKITFSGYLETYYSYDFGNPSTHQRPPFFYSFNRHNETNLNLGFVKANYSSLNVRANLALMGGTYAQYNLASEQDLLSNIFEANAGFKILTAKNLWFDAGILPSHIGFESAIGKDCWNLTRSILADNSPYYEAGAKVGYTSSNEKLYLAFLYLNGWQKIQKLKGNQTPAFGFQITHKPNAKVVLNYSNYIGNEQPDSNKLWRNFHNLYAQFQFTDKLGLITGFDIGAQQKTKGGTNYSIWYSPVLIARYCIHDKFRVAVRAEYYSDNDGVIIPSSVPNGFQTFGYSLNLDYLPAQNIMFRVEGRGLNSKDNIFTSKDHSSASNYFMTTSLAISF